MSEQQKAKLLYEESDLRGLYDALTAAHAQVEELRVERDTWKRRFEGAVRDIEARRALADQGASPVKCPDCYGKGLTDQDDGLGILLNVDGSTTECRTCRGSGVASSGKDKAKGAINDWSF